MRRSSLLIVLVTVLLAFSCTTKASGPDLKSVAVFVPGVASGSPIYEMLVKGASEAVAAVPGARLKVVEGGFDQSAWLGSLRDIASSGEFGLIVSSNPALPELAAKIAADFPDIRFFIADAYLEGNPSIHTVLYNQIEQGYIVGFLAGLVTKARRPNAAPVAGLIAAHRYPTLDQLIRPGFEAGLKAVDPDFVLEYREVGNWYDANKAAELAGGLYASGVEVVLPIAGGAGQGVVAAARERGKSVVWFDGGGYALGPDTVIGCATLAQDQLVASRVTAILGGKTSLFGQADIVSAADGYIGFDADGDGYRTLPAEIRGRFEAALAGLKAGQPDFTITSF
jgi:simple sugar transport system substrate-binding protein